MENNESKTEESTTIIDATATSQLYTCDYCHKGYLNIDSFSCPHKICSICLFRRIFILNITELNGSSDSLKIKCSLCAEGEITKNLDELCELSSQKSTLFKEMAEKQGMGNSDNSNKCPEHHLFKDTLCLDCCEHLCKKCKSNPNNTHFKHNIMNNEKVSRVLKAEINNIPLKFKTKDLFEHNWNVICKKIKDSSQETFNETINKIEELTKALTDFKKEYETKYKIELTKIVKTLKVLKLFYFDYYFEKEEAPKGRDLDSLRYVNSINSELLNLEMSKDVTYIQKINDAKIILDNLKSNNNINFTTKFIYAKLKNNYNYEYEIKPAHDKFITSIFELKDDKLLTTSIDYSMKIWDEKDSTYVNSKTISKRCGCIISALQLDDDKILTSNNSNNAIYMWAPNPNDGYAIEQSLTLHSKPVVCMTKLKNGNLVTSGMDNLLIVWQKKDGGFYEEKQTIEEKFLVKKLVGLDKNKFGYTGDDGVLRIMAEKEETNDETNNPENNEENKTEENNNEEDKTEENKIEENKTQTGTKTIKYQKICELTRHQGKINCMCELKNGYLFTGGAKGTKNDHQINVWKPDGNDGYVHYQTLSGHKTDISDIIQLNDGRIVSSSRDRTLIIWKETMENDNIKYVQDEVLSEYPHGMYGLLQLRDGRICTITSNNSIIFWRKWGSLAYC